MTGTLHSFIYGSIQLSFDLPQQWSVCTKVLHKRVKYLQQHAFVAAEMLVPKLAHCFKCSGSSGQVTVKVSTHASYEPESAAGNASSSSRRQTSGGSGSQEIEATASHRLVVSLAAMQVHRMPEANFMLLHA